MENRNKSKSKRRRVILIGGGYSVTEGLKKDLWKKIENEEIWSLNYAVRAMPYLPKRQIWTDWFFLKNNINYMQELSRQGVSLHSVQGHFEQKTVKKYPFLAKVKLYAYTYSKRKQKDKVYYRQVTNVGIFALSIAMKEERDEIYLLGYDFGICHPTQKKTHFYEGKISYMSYGVGRVDSWVCLVRKVNVNGRQVILPKEKALIIPKKGVNVFNIYRNKKKYI
ncbi:MAG: hypothetical protein ABIH08_03840 [Candidatus Omnitrophota bacterium]